MSAADVIKLIKDNNIQFVGLRFTDTSGTAQRITVPSRLVDADWFVHGHAVDGTSIAGSKGIQASRIWLLPDPCTARIDSFYDEPTVCMACDVTESSGGSHTRYVASNAESYQQPSSGAGTASFDAKPESFIFNGASWSTERSRLIRKDQT